MVLSCASAGGWPAGNVDVSWSLIGSFVHCRRVFSENIMSGDSRLKTNALKCQGAQSLDQCFRRTRGTQATSERFIGAVNKMDNPRLMKKSRLVGICAAYRFVFSNIGLKEVDVGCWRF